ncbi:MAG: TIGR03621 family F420-dependent LLM class oxidoreductase [Actinomycetota bacterium]|nr:TIGR03621 family F420-dependent LLM class oxidoreductase [Actinomycetota bacterium]
MTHPFRFGLQSYSSESPEAWREMAKKAESLGFSSFHLADHYIGEGPALQAANHPEQNLAAIPAMMVAAEATDSIRIGCRVLCCDYHQPVVLAKEVATIDWFSGGRLELGLGAGWVQSEYEAMGIPMLSPGRRIDRMVETLDLIRQHYGAGQIEIQGDHVQASGFNGVPTTGAVPPVMIGGGSKRVLGIAGREADIVSINFNNSAGKIGPEGVGSGTNAGTLQKIQWIKDGAGERFQDLEIEIAAYFTVVTDHVDAVCGEFAKLFGLSADEIQNHPHCLIGPVDHIIDSIRQRREEYGINYVTFGGAVMDDVAPVVEALAGS